MKTLTHILHTFTLATTLLTTICLQSMNENQHATIASHTQYNELTPFICLPKEIEIQILPHCVSEIKRVFLDSESYKNELVSLQDTIKTFIQLRSTCKHFYTLLNAKEIGNFCKPYGPYSKYMALNKIINNTNYERYEAKRLYALILLSPSTIDLRIECTTLLQDAVLHNDAPFVDILLKRKANPYAIMIQNYIIFHIKSPAVAQVFINNNVDFTIGTIIYPNILWYIVSDEYSSDIMQLYLNHKINPRLLDNHESCLLHRLATSSCCAKRANDFLQKAKLLLNAIPDMINIVNKENYTPLDCAQYSWGQSYYDTRKATIFKKLILLYKHAGGLPAKKLTKPKKQEHCIIS